jgi:hypothetical protein
LLQKVSEIWAGALKKFLQPCHKPKKFKEYQFQVVPNYLPAQGGHISWVGPDTIKKNTKSLIRHWEEGWSGSKC